MASRYNSYDSRSSTSSYFSDPSSSTELSYKHLTSRAIVDSKPAYLSKIKDLIAEDLKKTARKGTGFMGLQGKLFGKENKKEMKGVKALTEAKVNGNTRTLAMVLKSERELLSANKEQELEIHKLKLMLEVKNKEVEKLKDLCLKQREEIRSLKNSILFPDTMNSQLQELLEQQGSELNQAKQLIPTLQRQVTSLAGQLQYLADDLAEVKADKYPTACIHYPGSSPGIPSHDHEETANSLDRSISVHYTRWGGSSYLWEFSSYDGATPGSPDDMLLKDLNPCLTPYCAEKKSK
ncbi:STRUCTURAL MAINTENANCE OF CHROMOSOMES PROTEIN, partial [Salix purpurea]